MSNQILRSVANDTDPSPAHDETNVLVFPQTSAQVQQIFTDIETDMPFHEGNAFENMLTFADNLEEPIHRWYQYKEGYSYRLVNKILQSYSIPQGYNSVLDPFAGAGTTLLAAQFSGLSSVGIELNPFASLLSYVKSQWKNINKEEISEALEIVIKSKDRFSPELPELTTFHKEQYFPEGSAYELFKIRDAIATSEITSLAKKTLFIALASTIEDVSCLHKDGRLLRYKPRKVITPKDALQLHANEIIEDLNNFQNRCDAKITIIQGDSRNMTPLLRRNHIDKKFGLILYSPPYLNNFDYCEIYKCELWLLGLIKSYEEWRNLRQMTFRSHPSCQFPITHHLRNHYAQQKAYLLVEQLAHCHNIGGYAQKQAPKVIRGYFDDIFSMLQEQSQLLAPEGHIVCVIGNSKHGELHIPADTIIAEIGKAVGLELLEIYVAKYRNNRKQKNLKLRESLVVFRKSGKV